MIKLPFSKSELQLGMAKRANLAHSGPPRVLAREMRVWLPCPAGSGPHI